MRCRATAAALGLVALTFTAPVGAAEPPAAPQAPTPGDEGPSVDVLVARAQQLATKQDWTQAETVYREALDRDPDRAAAWRGLGYVLRKQGHASDARAAYEKALDLAPNDPDTLLGLGETYVAIGRSDDAKLLLERLRPLDRRHAATLTHVIRTAAPR